MANIVSSIINMKQIATLSQLTLIRQIGFMFVVATSIALGTSIVLWSTTPNYVALFLDMSPQDSADVISALQDSNTDYKVDTNTGIISVPAESVQETKLMMASRGLPSSSQRGYSVLEEEQGLGTSNFMEQARYHRALEQELVETIKHIQIVRNARVHLSIPKHTSFLRSVNKPSASVMIELIGLQGLSDTQLNGILHLITSSVAGMEPSNVSIVDQRGNLLSQNGNSNLGNSNENIRLTRQFEQDYSSRITSILTPMVGTGNVRTQVSADLDFTFIETTEETYNPNNVVVRSEQTQEERSGSNSSTVEPGSLSELPPLTGPQQNPLDLTAGNNSQQKRTNSTRNYEIDRSVSLIRRVPGTIRKLSVAVLVDLHGSESTEAILDEEEAAVENSAELDALKIERITQLVQEAIGFDAARGDTVSVIHEPFVADAELPPAEPLAFWKTDWFFSILKQVAAGIGVIFLIFGVLRPAMQLTLAPPTATNSSSALQSADGVELTGEHIQASANGDPMSAPALGSRQPSYDQNLIQAQSLVQNEPARAARMIQNWLTNE